MATISKFMIIDPARETRSTCERVLESLGYGLVASLDTNAEALDLMLQRQVQFLIFNWQSSPNPGYVFMQKVRSNPKLRFVPVIILSKTVQGPDIRLATELGFQKIMPAAIDPAALKKAIGDMIAAEEKLTPEQLKLRDAAALVNDGKVDQALPMLDEISKAVPTSAEVARLLAELLVQRDRIKEADAALQPAATANPNDVHLVQLLAKVYSKSGRHKEAVEVLVRLNELSPLNLTTLLGLGNAHETAGNDEQAKDAYGKVRALDPDSPEAAAGLGRIAVNAGDYTEAVKYFNDPSANTEVVRIFNNSGIAAVTKGDVDRALECYKSALALLNDNPDIYRVRYNLGLAQRSKGLLNEAFETFFGCLDSPLAEKACAALVRCVELMKQKSVKFDDKKYAQAVAKLKSLKKAG